MSILKEFTKRVCSHMKKTSTSHDLNGSIELQDGSIELPVYEELSKDKNYKFEIYKKPNYYIVITLEKVTDDFDLNWFDYAPADDFVHLTDTLDRAVEIGQEFLICFA